MSYGVHDVSRTSRDAARPGRHGPAWARIFTAGVALAAVAGAVAGAIFVGLVAGLIILVAGSVLALGVALMLGVVGAAREP